MRWNCGWIGPAGLAAAGLAAALLAACAGDKLPERFHTLVPAQRAASAPAAHGATLYVDVLPVGVPAQVDHAQFVVRQPDDSLLLLEQDRWAAPLQDELRAAIVERLSAQWGAVDVRGVGLPLPAIWRVRVEVQRFESIPGREARLEGAWSISSTQRGGATLVCRSAIAESVAAAGIPALAQAHRRAAAQLADEIGRRLKAMQAGERTERAFAWIPAFAGIHAHLRYLHDRSRAHAIHPRRIHHDIRTPGHRMTIETHDDVLALQRVGRVVCVVLKQMLDSLEPGMTTRELDALGDALLARHGARSAPRLTYDFPGATCISVNEEAAHGVPGDRVIRAGDVVNVDVSAELDGYFADTGGTRVVAPTTATKTRLCHATRTALDNAMKQARDGRPINGIGAAIERTAKAHGFKVIENLGSHGVGRALHEEPEHIAGTFDRSDRRTLREGMVITIEPFLSTKSRMVSEAGDGWTLVGAAGNLSAQYEHTMIITKGQPIVVTLA
jgi:methionyl aminopeptidase